MSPFRRDRHLTRAVALVAAAALLHGCTVWRAEPLLPSTFGAGAQRGLVRVTLPDGNRLSLRNPVILGDSLIGQPADGKDPNGRVAVALADVRMTEVSHIDGNKTVSVVFGVGAMVLLIAALASSDPPPPPPPSGGCAGCTFSCPLIYSWDGHEWRLDSGTFGGAIVEALARTDVDNLVFARAVDGRVRLRLVNELNETDYADAVHLLAVDHDPDVSVAPDAAGALHTFGAAQPPIRATDYRGTDVLARVRAVDGWQWESVPTGRDTSRAADLWDGLVLTFARPRGAQEARLVLDANNTPWAAAMLGLFVQAHGSATAAWYDSLNHSPALAGGLGERLAREAFLTVAVKTGAGWTPQGRVWEAGPEVSKRQVVRLDLSGVSGDTIRVRLDAPAAFWIIDRVAIDYGPERPLRVTELRPHSAVTFSGTDVRAVLDSTDRASFRMETGEGAIVSFIVSPPMTGQARSYLVRSSGWYRIHTTAVGAPDSVLLRRVMSEPGAIGKISVAQLNVALARLEAQSR